MTEDNFDKFLTKVRFVKTLILSWAGRNLIMVTLIFHFTEYPSALVAQNLDIQKMAQSCPTNLHVQISEHERSETILIYYIDISVLLDHL